MAADSTRQPRVSIRIQDAVEAESENAKRQMNRSLPAASSTYDNRPMLDTPQKFCNTSSLISVSIKRFIEQQETERRLSKLVEKNEDDVFVPPSIASSKRRASCVILGRSSSSTSVSAMRDKLGPGFFLDKLPDKLLTKIFSFVPHRDKLRLMLVSRKWRTLLSDATLWRHANFRTDYGGLPISNVESLIGLIGTRFSSSLQTIELPCDLVTVPVLHELTNKCPNVKYMALDFSNAMQLHDYSDLSAFPRNLYYLCICLSDVIFMEGLMRRIYSCLSCIQVLHLIGTFESTSETVLASALATANKETGASLHSSTGDSSEAENCEVINLTKLRSSMPNLRVINLFGILFITDSHVETIVQNSLQLEALALNFCMNVKGYSFKLLIQKCRRLKTLLLQHCELENQAIDQADWQDAVNLTELDISCTELSDQCILNMLMRVPKLTYLSVAHCDAFTDHVMETLMSKNSFDAIRAIDLSYTTSISDSVMGRFIQTYGPHLVGLMANGKPKLGEGFWLQAIAFLGSLRTCVMGTSNGTYLGITTRVHIDQVIAKFAQSCPHLECLEIQWDPDTIRFSEKSSKFIDLLRMRCPHLRKITLSDGEYYEMVRANFERAGVGSAARTMIMYNTSLVNFLHCYRDLKFN